MTVQITTPDEVRILAPEAIFGIGNSWHIIDALKQVPLVRMVESVIARLPALQHLVFESNMAGYKGLEYGQQIRVHGVLVETKAFRGVKR